MSKNKGTRNERELFHMFYDAGHMPLRIAGSGSTPIPSCDLVVNCNKKHLAIECKSLKKKRKYLEEEDVMQLKTFAERFNAVPLLAIRFDREGWYFLNINNLEKTKNNFVISLEYARKYGLSFEQLSEQN
ncbi:hypothetical protein J4409_00390 [Candidatus Woesearchaeota archaeon]|nr:hypothetical protein [Candidatus Woesearchaeota archaeon]